MADWRIFLVFFSSVRHPLGKEVSLGPGGRWTGLSAVVGLGGFFRVHRDFFHPFEHADL